MKNINEKIKEMLKENTGVHFLDSGSAYGRHWQQNQDKDFDKEDSVIVSTWGDNDISVSYNIYHFLTTFLDITKESEKLNKQLNKVMDKSEDYYLADIEKFIEENNYIKIGSDNSYNYDNLLSQVIQYTIFTLEKYNNHSEPFYADKVFMVLQIHGGCDVRGGYTKPYIFEINDIEYMTMAQYDINVSCQRCNKSWYSDDSGNNWYSDNNDIELETISKDKYPHHKNCGGKLLFSVMDSY